MKAARSLVAVLIAAVVIAAPAAATPRGSADGGIGLRLLDAPLDARNDPRAQVYIVDHLPPGTVIHRRIEVSNDTGSAASIRLYAAAATISEGSFLGAAGHTPNDLSTWTSLSPPVAGLPAGGRLSATVTIAVPSDAAPGEQYGVVWAEARSPESAGGVVQVSRVGIRLYVSVGPGGAPAADFTIGALTAERSVDGRPMVLATVHNTGGRALDMSGTLELLAGPGQLTAGPFPATLGTTLAIGDTGAVAIVLDPQLPAGPWDAVITLHSGLVERSARATIMFPAAGATLPVPTGPSPPGWLYPAIAALVVLTLLGLAGLRLVRRRPRRWAPAPS